MPYASSHDGHPMRPPPNQAQPLCLRTAAWVGRHQGPDPEPGLGMERLLDPTACSGCFQGVRLACVSQESRSLLTVLHTPSSWDLSYSCASQAESSPARGAWGAGHPGGRTVQEKVTSRNCLGLGPSGLPRARLWNWGDGSPSTCTRLMDGQVAWCSTQTWLVVWAPLFLRSLRIPCNSGNAAPRLSFLPPPALPSQPSKLPTSFVQLLACLSDSAPLTVLPSPPLSLCPALFPPLILPYLGTCVRVHTCACFQGGGSSSCQEEPCAAHESRLTMFLYIFSSHRQGDIYGSC